MTNPVANASNWATFCFGGALTAILAWLPWRASYGQLSAHDRLHSAWVSPVLILGAIFAIAFGVLALWIQHKVKVDLRQRNELFCEEMDSIERMHTPDSYPDSARP